jgi:hypothetical protein
MTTFATFFLFFTPFIERKYKNAFSFSNKNKKEEILSYQLAIKRRSIPLYLSIFENYNSIKKSKNSDYTRPNATAFLLLSTPVCFLQSFQSYSQTAQTTLEQENHLTLQASPPFLSTHLLLIELIDRNEILSVVSQSAIWIDSTSNLKIKYILLSEQKNERPATKPSGLPILNFGNATLPIWVEMQLINRTSQQDWILELGSAMINAELYLINEEGKIEQRQKVGPSCPFRLKDYFNNFIIYNLKLEPQKPYRLFIRIEGNYVQVPIYVSTLKPIFNFRHRFDFVWGLYFGFVLLIALYNSFLFITLRDASYFYYIYVLLVGLGFGQMRGYLYEYLPEAIAIWIAKNGSLTISLSGILALIFMQSFLNLKATSSTFIQMAFKTNLVET